MLSSIIHQVSYQTLALLFIFIKLLLLTILIPVSPKLIFQVGLFIQFTTELLPSVFLITITSQSRIVLCLLRNHHVISLEFFSQKNRLIVSQHFFYSFTIIDISLISFLKLPMINSFYYVKYEISNHFESFFQFLDYLEESFLFYK